MSEEKLIAEAGRRLSEAAPDAPVILFGSHARAERWGPVPGTLMHDALRDGRVFAGA